jgi:hypothetical protein
MNPSAGVVHSGQTLISATVMSAASYRARAWPVPRASGRHHALPSPQPFGQAEAPRGQPFLPTVPLELQPDIAQPSNPPVVPAGQPSGLCGQVTARHDRPARSEPRALAFGFRPRLPQK